MGEVPDVSRAVWIVAPHTSNWDFVVGVAAMLKMGLRANWLGKHSIFDPPFGGLLRWLGGIATERSAAHGVVGQMVRAFAQEEPLVLALAPEGTRSPVKEWKSGFYYIAQQAEVPVFAVALDYPTRSVVLGRLFETKSDSVAGIAEIKAYYAQFRGKKEQHTGTAD